MLQLKLAGRCFFGPPQLTVSSQKSCLSNYFDGVETRGKRREKKEALHEHFFASTSIIFKGLLNNPENCLLAQNSSLNPEAEESASPLDNLRDERLKETNCDIISSSFSCVWSG